MTMATAPDPDPLRPLQRLARALRRLAGGVLALLILFEEWGWQPLQRAMARLAAWPAWRRLEGLIQRLPPWAALCVFALPALALLPIKLGALALIANGQRLGGVALIVAAKLLGTAVVARLFELTRPALMQLAWFAHWYGRWLPWKQGLLDRVRASWAWRAGRVFKRALRRRWAGR